MPYALVEEPIKDTLAYYGTVCTVQQVAKEDRPSWPRPNVVHHRLLKANRTVLQIRFFEGRNENEFASAEELRQYKEAIEAMKFKLEFAFYEVSLGGNLWLINKEALAPIATNEEYIRKSLHLPHDRLDAAGQNDLPEDSP